MEELWDIYDKCAKKTGNIIERGKNFPSGLYHLVVHIWVINSAGEWLIQKRAANLSWKPGIWAVTGGSAITGEDAYTAACRELYEELGIQVQGEETTGTMEFMMEIRRHNSLCSVWVAHTDLSREELKLQKEEVEDAMWVSQEKLNEMLAERTFYNYDYISMLFHYMEENNIKGRVII